MIDGLWGTSQGTVYAADLQGKKLLVTSGDGGVWGAGPASPTDTQGFYGIWGTAANDFYAVGATSTSGLIAHYDGVTLSAEPVSLPYGGFSAVWGSSATDVYAVGSTGAIAHANP